MRTRIELTQVCIATDNPALMAGRSSSHTSPSPAATPRTGYRQLLRRYERYAPDYDRRFARYSDRTLDKALELVPDIEGDLLDVACGTGLFELKLQAHRRRLRATGVDISPQMLERARQRFAHDGANVRFDTGVAERLDVPDQSFDVVVCNNAFHLVQDAPAALREFARVLRPGGRAIIVDWCVDYPQVRLMQMYFRVIDHHGRHIRSLDSMSRLLEKGGFRVVHEERFRVPPLWGLMAIAGEKSPRPLPRGAAD